MRKFLTTAGICLVLGSANAQTYDPAPYCGFRNYSASLGYTPDYISAVRSIHSMPPYRRRIAVMFVTAEQLPLR